MANLAIYIITLYYEAWAWVLNLSCEAYSSINRNGHATACQWHETSCQNADHIRGTLGKGMEGRRQTQGLKVGHQSLGIKHSG